MFFLRNRLWRAIWFLGLLCSGEVCQAHPHVFIDSYVNVVFDEQGLAGFEMVWLFDDMTSSGYILDYDQDRDGGFDSEETAVIKQEAFDNLAEYHYMVFIFFDEKPFTVRYVKDFQAEIRNKRLVYRYFIPCHVPASQREKTIRFSVYDETYFVDFTLKDREIRLTNRHAFDIRYQVLENRNISFYFGQFHPKEIVLKYKTK